MRPPHTLLNESFRLQFPFVFRQLQSLQLLLLARPCLSAFSGLPLSRPCAASASLSDPRCFRSLSVASVLGSDYSASVSSFPFSSRFRLTVASPVLRFRSRFHGFPRSSSLVSRAFIPGSRTRLPVCFLSSFPVSLPQPLLRCFPSFPLPYVRFFSGLFRLLSGFFRPLQPASDYSAFCPFFSPLPDLPWQRFSRCATVPFVPVAFLFRFACFHASLPIPVLSSLRFLSPSGCFVSQALRSFWPPVSSSAIPLCFRFRFRLLGLSVLNFSVRLRSRICYHRNLNLSIPIFYIFQLSNYTLHPKLFHFFDCSLQTITNPRTASTPSFSRFSANTPIRHPS